MHISSIVSEYNPFHNGHCYQIQQTRILGATHIVAIMSPNFVQRGESAIFDKFSRAKMALKNGVDLVIELPLPYAVSTAELFAHGAVSTLNAMGCIDSISFGCEDNDIELLKKIAKTLLTDDYNDLVKKSIKNGQTFAKVRQDAIAKLCGEKSLNIISKPNNTLGIEYIKSLYKLNSKIKPLAISRIGSSHDEISLDNETLSATHIRKLIRENNFTKIKNFIPSNTYEDIINLCENGLISDYKNLEIAILAKLRTMNREDFLKFSDASEGLENKILSSISNSRSIEELYDNIKSKRYTMARIRRIILNSFLEIPNDFAKNPPPYIRVLGFNSNGLEILSKLKKTSKLKIITKAKDISSLAKLEKNYINLESKSTDIYSLSTKCLQKCGMEFSTPIVKI